MPWIVRVFFESANSMKGRICSGEIITQHSCFRRFLMVHLATIIDRYWLVTSKKCCLNQDEFNVIFDDKNKSQWLFTGKKRHKKCVRKQFCSKMHPRNDQEI